LLFHLPLPEIEEKWQGEAQANEDGKYGINPHVSDGVLSGLLIREQPEHRPAYQQIQNAHGRQGSGKELLKCQSDIQSMTRHKCA
jgi:hypothetical protein